MTVSNPLSRLRSRSDSDSSFYNEKPSHSVKQQLQEICSEETFKKLIIIGDCSGRISYNTKIQPGAYFNLREVAAGNVSKLDIINSEIGPKAQISVGSSIINSKVEGIVNGGIVRGNSTIHASAIMDSGRVENSQIYGIVNGGNIESSAIGKDITTNTGDSVKGQTLGKVPAQARVRQRCLNARHAMSSAVHSTITRYFEDISE